MAKKQSSYELARVVGELGISVDDFYDTIDIDTKACIPMSNSISRLQIETVLTILDEVTPWFDTHREAWKWFTSEKLSGFGNMTAAQVIRTHRQKGADSVANFVKSKSFGGFN